MSKKNTITFSLPQVILIWNTLHELQLLVNFSKEFQNWSDIFIIYAKDEINKWEQLTEDQRKLIQGGELTFPMGKINAEFLPETTIPRHYNCFAWISNGLEKRQQPKTQIEKLLEATYESGNETKKNRQPEKEN